MSVLIQIKNKSVLSMRALELHVLRFIYAKDKATDLAGAIGNPWYDFAPEKAPDEMFDVRKALTALLNRAGKANNVNDTDLLAKLRQLETVED